MADATTTGLSGQKPAGKKSMGGRRRAELERIHQFPLPVALTPCQPPALRSILGLLGLPTQIPEKPVCEGVFDPTTQSVWIMDHQQAQLLWRRGFFGKGHLSRSEPSWLARQLNQRKLKMAGGNTSEELTAQRRADRRQFKTDRAQAILAAAAEAEKVFQSTGKAGDAVERVIPSAATWKQNNSSTKESLPTNVIQPGTSDEETLIEDVEHLQLTLQEAFFLSWALDCLIVSDNEGHVLSLDKLWITCCQADKAVIMPGIIATDTSFIMKYAVYHRFRSLGWVVKGGVKFCVDFLLYKRGPVFSHAEFAVLIVPVFEDPTQAPPGEAQAKTWSWLSTVNRVNSQVQKILVLAYVTVPSQSALTSQMLHSPACLSHYHIQEIIVRRFVPARMRD